MFGLELGSLIAIGVGVILCVIQVSLLISIYRKCPPNQAMIVSGMYAGADREHANSYKVVLGGGVVVLPMLQQISYISLEVRKIQIKLEAALTSDGVPLSFELDAQIKVKSDATAVVSAAECFLGKSQEEVDALVADVISGIVRKVLANTSEKQFRSGFDTFKDAVNAELISKIGVTLVSLTTKNLAEPAKISNPVELNDDVRQLGLMPTIDIGSRSAVIAEYERAMPILERQLGEQSIVFKEFLLRFAAIVSEGDDYMSREKAVQLTTRANKI